MGVEHYLVCPSCKEYIDLHKAYSFNNLCKNERPPAGLALEDETLGRYWNGRGIWFLWQHRSHTPPVELHYDCEDGWYDLEPKLKEVFPYSDDLKLRKQVDGAG